MKENGKENKIKAEDTSAKEKAGRKISDDDIDQVSGGVGVGNGAMFYVDDPIKPINL